MSLHVAGRGRMVLGPWRLSRGHGMAPGQAWGVRSGQVGLGMGRRLMGAGSVVSRGGWRDHHPAPGELLGVAGCCRVPPFCFKPLVSIGVSFVSVRGGVGIPGSGGVYTGRGWVGWCCKFRRNPGAVIPWAACRVLPVPPVGAPCIHWGLVVSVVGGMVGSGLCGICWAWAVLRVVVRVAWLGLGASGSTCECPVPDEGPNP